MNKVLKLELNNNPQCTIISDFDAGLLAFAFSIYRNNADDITAVIDDLLYNYDDPTCDTLLDGTVETIDNDLVTYVRDYAFYECTSLTSVNLPNVTTIGRYAFCKCTSLTSVNLPSVTEIGSSTFDGCTSLTFIDLLNATTIGSSTFHGCSSLISVDLPNITQIGSNTFNRCTSLTSVNLPNVMKIGQWAFDGCTSLTSINLPNVTEINDRAFNGCESLVSVDLPTVTTIGQYVFNNCKSLTSVILSYDGSVVTLDNNRTFAYTPIVSGTGYIYVPDSLVDSYKSDTAWSTYADQIKPISEINGQGGVANE